MQNFVEIASDVQKSVQLPSFMHSENTNGARDLVIDFGELPHSKTEDSKYDGTGTLLSRLWVLKDCVVEYRDTHCPRNSYDSRSQYEILRWSRDDVSLGEQTTAGWTRL